MAPKDLCYWTGKGEHQQIICSGGRVAYLYLERCGLTSLPASIGKLTGLQYLYLNNNSLTSLPTSLSKLTSVTAGNLHVGNNKLAKCPSLAILAMAGGAISGNPSGQCGPCPCGTKFVGAGLCSKVAGGCLCGSHITNAADCAAALELKAAAPCLAPLSLRSGTNIWENRNLYHHQYMRSRGGRITAIYLNKCCSASSCLKTLPESIGNI